MILTLLRISFINLRRDRVVQALTFLLPIVFFSIFALVFSNQSNPTRKVDVALIDADQSDYSRKLVHALETQGSLDVRTTSGLGAAARPFDRAAAEKAVRDGDVPVAIVLPHGLGEGHRLWGGGANSTAPVVDLLADVSDPIAPQMVQGILQEVSFTAAPEAMAGEGIERFRQYAGPLTPAQEASVAEWMASLKSDTPSSGSGAASSAGPAIGLPIHVVNVMQSGKQDTSMVSFYAAGIGVMFLMFSCAGAGGALLEEEEAGTLGRLLGSRLGMGGILAGKWLFLTVLGVLQLTVMFTWGALVFQLPLLSHLPGFGVMTIVTAGTVAGFGLVLATISRSRQQLSGLSTILILSMSALGGSMFPRFLMTQTMQNIGKVAFNAWALDGYQKVFWRDARIVELWPEVSVLLAVTIVFLALARRFARRWETL